MVLEAVENGDSVRIQWLVEHGPKKYNRAFLIAVYNEKLGAVQLLHALVALFDYTE